MANRAMKHSGVEWVGRIPKEWKVYKIAQMFKQHKLKNEGLIERNLLSLSYGNVIRRDFNSNEGLLPDSFEGYNIIEEEDIVLRMTDLQNDHKSLRVGFNKERGIITSAYITIRKSAAVNSRYGYYYLHTFDLCKGFYGMGAGVRQGVNFNELKKLDFIYPPFEEQQKIVAFLDGKVAHINNIIEDTKKSIENLKAYKQSLITETVTKGLNPNVEMKDSGIEWIGDIPNNWNIAPISRLFIIKAGGDAKPEFYSEAPDKEHLYPVYTNTNIENKVYAYTSNPLFPAESITVTGRGAIGKAFYRNTPFDAIIRLIVLMAKFNFDTRYFAYFISNVIQFNTGSSAISQLSTLQIAPYKLAVPPVDEQHKIADFLDKKTTNIDSLIDQKDILITELESYKKSLIYEYVTGKKEVK